MIKFDYTNSGISAEELAKYSDKIQNAHRDLHGKTCAGSDFLGWLSLPADYDKIEFKEIKKAADEIRANSDVLLVCGIGGSYLGARAGIEFVKGNLANQISKNNMPKIYFIGNSISSDYLADLLDIVRDKRVSINVISKSGTTLEPALAFRFLRELMEEKYGEDAHKRIYATTDKSKGALKNLADSKGYKTFAVPDDVGGRYSVLTAVGLLPLACSGLNIDLLMQGARESIDAYDNENLAENECYQYAAVRNILLEKGKNIEIMASFEPSLHYFAEWWKQLFGESEGKGHKGIFPASVEFSTDLHSLGQYIQDGQRQLFETVLKTNEPNRDIKVKQAGNNGDGLEFVEGKMMSFINDMARQGTMQAHISGGVPNLVLELPKRDEKTLGQLIYFFEKACAISGSLLGVNPFDQPGVEEYKKNMYALLK